MLDYFTLQISKRISFWDILAAVKCITDTDGTHFLAEIARVMTAGIVVDFSSVIFFGPIQQNATVLGARREKFLVCVLFGFV